MEVSQDAGGDVGGMEIVIGGVCAQRARSAGRARTAHIKGINWGFCFLLPLTILLPLWTILYPNNLMFDANPQSWAEPIQMSSMTFQCHRRANRWNGSVALLLILTGLCRSL